ncbi:MAG: ATP-binding cassette domain-containing protein [Monoglobus pectinilyticus]
MVLTVSAAESFLYGKKTEIKNPSQAIAEGIALVPEDRKEQGLILINTVRFNMTLTILKQYIKRFKINKKVERQIINRLINDLAIKYSGEDTICVNMSGGNQQKVVLGKWLATNPRILILDEPTRGIDVATKAELYRMIQSLADEGIAILMISSELPEIVNLCTRVLVMYEGRITADIKEKEQINQINIMHYAVGGVK